MKYIEIGNENGGPAYDERYALFYDAIKATYPDIKIVANVPTRQRPTEILDEHYYSLPEFFMANAFRYDTYDRKGSHIYVGEYAVTQNAGQGNLRAAVGEAAFMTGMERNADVVVMSSYAPLFVNPGWRRWNPNAIVFDASRCYGTPSYHVQSMFARHRSDVVLPLELKSPPLSAKPRSGRIGIGTWATQAEFKDIQVVRDGKTLWAFDPQRGLQEWEISSGDWEIVDGALRQTSPKTPACAFTGERDWTEYTIQLKARKLSGSEGFLISFLSQDPNGKSWWNLGGWGNREHGIESDGMAASHVAGQIETGRWYDIRIEVAGPGVRCFLDDQLVQEVKQGQLSALYAVAGSKRDTGEVILKVVCASNEPQTTTISLAGTSKVAPQVPVCVLTSKTPEDENSFEEPTKVVPQETTFEGASNSFDYTFPPYSVTIMRIKVRPGV